MEHSGEADLRPEMLRVGCDGEECVGGGAEQEIVDDGLTDWFDPNAASRAI